MGYDISYAIIFLIFLMNYFTNLKFILLILNSVDVDWQIWGLIHYPTTPSPSLVVFVFRPSSSVALRSTSVGGCCLCVVGFCAMPSVSRLLVVGVLCHAVGLFSSRAVGIACTPCLRPHNQPPKQYFNVYDDYDVNDL